MGSTPTGSAMLRRVSVEPSGYTMEVGLLNNGQFELTSWRATVTLPEGATMTSPGNATVDNQPGSQVYVVRPEPSVSLAPGQRQTVTVEVHETTQAPTSAEFTATGADGTTIKAPVAIMAAVVADETTWPGSTTLTTRASGTQVSADSVQPAVFDTDWGGGGGGGGGGGQTKFRVNFEWETTTNAGGGGGGGPQLPNLPNPQGSQGAQGAQNDWQQYQQQSQQYCNPQQYQGDASDEIKKELRALGERVTKLEGKGS